MNDISTRPQTESAHDVCALPLARRLAAMLNRDPALLREGEPLPRGWHVTLFNVPTPQSQLRHDGAASLGITLPDLGLPRLMLAGRQVRFDGDIPLGAQVRRETRQGGVQMKQGRSGRFALIKIEHRIFVPGSAQPAVVETQDYVLREAGTVTPAAVTTPLAVPAGEAAPRPDASMTITPDETLLFRYSAITDNPHRIHYDQAYATQVEGYPALVVNGSIPAMFLLELFRTAAGREPAAFTSRNVAPMFCARPLQLKALREERTDGAKGASWRLWAEDDGGNTTFDARAE